MYKITPWGGGLLAAYGLYEIMRYTQSGGALIFIGLPCKDNVYTCNVLPTKSDSDVILCLEYAK